MPEDKKAADELHKLREQKRAKRRANEDQARINADPDDTTPLEQDRCSQNGCGHRREDHPDIECIHCGCDEFQEPVADLSGLNSL